jgi:hypothetical protein
LNNAEQTDEGKEAVKQGGLRKAVDIRHDDKSSPVWSKILCSILSNGGHERDWTWYQSTLDQMVHLPVEPRQKEANEVKL